MNIGVLSGKGGTGKTTVSLNLALALKINYTDCDVEEPNGFIFLKPDITKTEDVMVEYPVIDYEKCSFCKKCVEACEFNSLAMVKNEIIVFRELCHGCGTCEIVCERGAVSFDTRKTGIIQEGKSYDIKCMRGLLNIGEPMAVPVIKRLLSSIPQGDNLIDCPPGTSCNVVTALNYSDAAILVTEPTVFGLHDMKMAVELIRMYGIPFGTVINKDTETENIIDEYCKKEKIDILGRIPFERKISELYSRGKLLYPDEEYRKLFDDMKVKVRQVLKWK